MIINERGIILEFASTNAPGPTGSVPPFSTLKAIAKIKLDESAMSPSRLKPNLANLKVQLAYRVNGLGLQYRLAKYLHPEGNAALFEASFPNLSVGNKVKYYFRILGLGFPFPSSPSPSYMVNFEVASSVATDSESSSTSTTGTGPIQSEDPVLEEGPSGPTAGPTTPPECPLVPPVLLFPLKLETRFVGRELWIRFVPDPAMINQLVQSANEREQKAVEDFSDAEEKKAAWRALVQKVGVYRAAWLIHQTREKATSADKPIMEIAVLPDKFDIYLYTNYDDGIPIHEDCIVTCGKTLQAFQEEKPWETDFLEAEKLGLAKKITLKNNEHKFDRITVIGRRANSSAQDFIQLLDAHRYTNGVSFLPYGTPTNNTEGEKTPYSSAKRQDADLTYDYLVESHIPEKNSWAGKTAAALGISADKFKHDRYANQRPDDLLQALKTILWWPLGQNTIHLLMGKESKAYSTEIQKWIWEHYQQYVQAQGPLSVMQIGRNPYGLLPVARTEPREGDDALFHFRTITQRLLKAWGKMVIDGVPKAGDGESEDVLSALAMQDCSTDHFAQFLMDKDTLIQLLKAQHLETAFDNDNELINRFLLINGISPRNGTALNNQWENMVNKNKEKIRGSEGILEGYLDNNLNGSKLFELIKEGEPVALTEELDLSLLVAGKEKYLPKLSNTINTKNVTQRKPRPGQINAPPLLSILELLIDRAVRVPKPNEAQKALRNAITALDDLGADGPWSKLQQAFAQVLDINAYRLDAWVTSAATRLLAQHRQKDPEGLQLGVFGWVEDLKRDDTSAIAHTRDGLTTYHDTYPEDGGGFIHAPSTTQATAAALAKSAFLANQKTETETKTGNAFALNLLSDRIQGAQRLHDGIRHGQDIAALLGYDFERRLHDLEADQYIAYFRQKYPFVDNKKALDTLNVVDGVKLLKGVQEESGFWEEITNGIDQKKIKQAIHYIDDVKDASADSLHFEALFQAAQGNHERAAAALDAFQGEGTPPVLDSLRTPLQGNALNYKFLYCLSNSEITKYKFPQKKDGQYELDCNIRAATEPVLEDWLDRQIGSLKKITFKVQVFRKVSDEQQLPAPSRKLLSLPDGPSFNEMLKEKKGPLFNLNTVDLQLLIDVLGVEEALVKTIDQYRREQATISSIDVLATFLKAQFRGDSSKSKQIDWLARVTFTSGTEASPHSADHLNEIQLSLADLKLGYLDLLMMAESPLDVPANKAAEDSLQKGTSEFEQRMAYFLRRQCALPSGLTYKLLPESSKELKRLWTLLRYFRRFLLNEKRLLPQDILPPAEAERAVYAKRDVQAVNIRLKAIGKFYAGLMDSLAGAEAPGNAREVLEQVARFGLKEAERVFGEKDPNDFFTKVHKAMMEAYTTYEAAMKKCAVILEANEVSLEENKELFDYLDTAAKALFGPSFRIIRPVRFPRDLDDFMQKEQKALIGFKPTNRNGQERIREWLQGLADIYPEMKAYEDAQLLRSAWGKSKEDYTLQIAQYTPVIEHREKYPWVALNEDERAKINGGPPDDEPPYPPGTFSMVIEGPENFKWEDTPLYLLPIWEGRDAIPQTTRNTGISFQYDAPNAEPPQSLLLAVPEPGQTDWKKEDLRDIVNDTLDLAKARLVDIDALKELGFLFPATLIKMNTNVSAGETPPPKPPFGRIQVQPWEGTGNLSITDDDDLVVEVAPNDKQMYLKLSGGPGKVAISLYGTDQRLVRNQMTTLPQRKKYTIPIMNRNIRYLQLKRVAGRQSITLTKIDHR